MNRAHPHRSLGQLGRPADLHLETLKSDITDRRTGLLPEKTPGQGKDENEDGDFQYPHF